MSSDPLYALPFVERVFRFDELDSTNTFAKQLTEYPSRGIFVVIAERQRAGRGQRDNRFFSDSPDGLWVSLIVPLKSLDEHFVVNRALALAACECTENVGSVRCTIKWPNDICLLRRKLGGILLESTTMPPLRIVAGIGLNVNLMEREFPSALRDRAISLRMATGQTYEKETLLLTLLRSFDHYMHMPSSAAHRLYEARLAGIGARAIIGGVEGVFAGVDEQGQARLQCDDKIRYFVSGPLEFAAGYVPEPTQGSTSDTGC